MLNTKALTSEQQTQIATLRTAVKNAEAGHLAYMAAQQALSAYLNSLAGIAATARGRRAQTSKDGCSLIYP